MTWEIVAGIFVLLGAFGSVGGVVFKLSRILTQLESTMQSLDDTLQELKAANAESHKHLHGRIDKHDAILTDHDRRIVVLEEHDKQRA